MEPESNIYESITFSHYMSCNQLKLPYVKICSPIIAASTMSFRYICKERLKSIDSPELDDTANQGCNLPRIQYTQ